MEIEIVESCPLGHTCEEIKDGKIHRCKWYVNVKGLNRNTNEEVDKWDCAIAWQPVLLVENNFETRGLAKSVQGYRNEASNVNKSIKELPNKMKAIEAKE